MTIRNPIPLLLALVWLPLAASADTMDEEIDYLLNAVGSSGCTFIRNGSEYSARDARGHLASKRRRGKRYFSSTEEFVERIASRSSVSGKPYRIRCRGEPVVDAFDWFTAQLAALRAGQTD